MPPANNSFIDSLFRSYSSRNPSAAASPNAPNSAPAQPVYTSLGGAYVPLDPAKLAAMRVDPNADLQAILRAMPEADAGPYASTAQGDAVTRSLYQKQLNTPYISQLAQALGPKHPLIAQMIDSAMAGASGAEQSHEAAMNASGGFGTGWGSGIADVAAGLRALPEMQLARRQQLEQIPLAYRQAQAQLAQTRTGTLQNLMSALNQYESNPAKILAQYSRNVGAEQIGAQSRENVAAMKDTERFQQSLNSDATKTAIAQLQAQAKRSSSSQLAALRQRFLGSLDAHIQAINNHYRTLENTPVLDATGASRPRNADEISQLEADRQREIEAEMGFGEFASQKVFGHSLLHGIALGNPAQQPATAAPSRLSPPGKNTGAPPTSLLKRGVISHFANGQSWTLGPNGNPVRVK